MTSSVNYKKMHIFSTLKILLLPVCSVWREVRGGPVSSTSWAVHPLQSSCPSVSSSRNPGWRPHRSSLPWTLSARLWPSPGGYRSYVAVSGPRTPAMDLVCQCYVTGCEKSFTQDWDQTRVPLLANQGHNKLSYPSLTNLSNRRVIYMYAHEDT